MFTVYMAGHYGNHRCLVEKNVPIAFIFPVDGRMVLGVAKRLRLSKNSWNILSNLFFVFRVFFSQRERLTTFLTEAKNGKNLIGNVKNKDKGHILEINWLKNDQ